MLIGNIDITEWNAKQWKATVENHGIRNDSEWTRGSPTPFLTQGDIDLKKIKVTLLIKDAGREKMTYDRSCILAMCLKPVELTLDHFTNHFYAVLTGHSFTEDVSNKQDKWHKLTMEFQGHEFGQEQAIMGSSLIVVRNPGNIITPAVIEITPQIGAASITLSGTCYDIDTGEDNPVTIKNLVTGKKVILDGETGMITEVGEPKFKDVDIWSLPALKPGENRITCSNEKMNVTVKMKPRYM